MTDTEKRTAYTPGSWKNDGMMLGRSPEHRFWEVVGGDPQRLIAQARTFSDARLITKAPELVEALRSMLKVAEAAKPTGEMLDAMTPGYGFTRVRNLLAEVDG